MTLQTKLKLLLLLLFVAAIGNSLVIFSMEKQGTEKLAWVTHTYEVINETEKYLSAMKDAETGQRGFLLTKDTSYLEPYHKGVEEAKNNFNQLKLLTQDNPLQQGRLDEIEKNMQLKFSELKETIELVENNKDKDALAIVKKNHGKQFMDNIRTLINAFTSEERVLFEKRNGDYREFKALVAVLIAVELVFFTSLAILTFYFLSKSLFAPLDRLLQNTHKFEEGDKLEISDVVPNDEIGYLMSRFYVMNEIVHERTRNLEIAAEQDSLTGLRNRSKLDSTIKKHIQTSSKLHKKTAFIYIDLDGFKQLNDVYGHDFGDSVLVECAERLNQISSQNKSIFRLGGDEFFVIIPNVDNKKHCKMFVHEIVSLFSRPMIIEDKQLNIFLSIGISMAPDNGKKAKELLNMADVAMYLAKNEDETSYRFFEESMFKRRSDVGDI